MEVWCGILEVTNDQKEKIIGLARAGSFTKEIISYVDKYLGFSEKYKILENTSIDAVNAGNGDAGIFLLTNDKTIQLVNKEKKVSVGYLYNTAYFETKALYTWKLIEFENVLRSVKHETQVIESETQTVQETVAEAGVEQTAVENNCRIPVFDFNTVEVNGSYLLVCRDVTSKINLLTHLISQFAMSEADMQNMLIISSKEEMAEEYHHRYPSARICHKYDKDTVYDFSMREKGCIVFDSCLSRKAMKMLSHNKNYFNVPFIMIVDDLEDLRGDFWSVFKYIMITADTSDSNRQMVWDRFSVSFPDEEEFNKLYTECTTNYGAMVVYNLLQ